MKRQNRSATIKPKSKTNINPFPPNIRQLEWQSRGVYFWCNFAAFRGKYSGGKG